MTRASASDDERRGRVACALTPPPGRCSGQLPRTRGPWALTLLSMFFKSEMQLEETPSHFKVKER